MNIKKGADTVEEMRSRVLSAIHSVENNAPYIEGFNLREQVTGPIVDSLYSDGEVLTKTLSTGIKLSFRYTSKIARDFAMSAQPEPDHAWEPQTTKLLLHLAKNVEHAVVGGAYFGDQAIPLAHVMAPVGLCHCFELDAKNAQMIQTNAEQNGLNNVRVTMLGLWSEPNLTLSLSGPQDSHAAPVVDVRGELKTTTIDHYCQTAGIKRLGLIMLDIEGGEFEALKGARHYLSMDADGAPSVIYEIHRSYVDWSNGLRRTEIVSFLEGFGYRQYAVRDYQGNVPMDGRPIELVELDDIYLEGPPHAFNIVAIKEPALLNDRNIRICRGVSPKLLFHRDPALHAPLS